MQSLRPPRIPRFIARVITLGSVATLGLASGGVLGTGCERASAEPVPHVRLGMAPREVRERFEPGTTGSWQTTLGTGDDTAIAWSADTGSSSGFRKARFEFHLGMLVAVRATSSEKPPASETVRIEGTSIIASAPSPEGMTAITILARDCPTHRDEAQSLAARAR